MLCWIAKPAITFLPCQSSVGHRQCCIQKLTVSCLVSVDRVRGPPEGTWAWTGTRTSPLGASHAWKGSTRSSFRASIHFRVPRVGRIPSMSPEYTRMCRSSCSSFSHVGNMLVRRSLLHCQTVNEYLAGRHICAGCDRAPGAATCRILWYFSMRFATAVAVLANLMNRNAHCQTGAVGLRDMGHETPIWRQTCVGSSALCYFLRNVDEIFHQTQGI